jgi:hypothetical protein
MTQIIFPNQNSEREQKAQPKRVFVALRHGRWRIFIGVLRCFSANKVNPLAVEARDKNERLTFDRLGSPHKWRKQVQKQLAASLEIKYLFDKMWNSSLFISSCLISPAFIQMTVFHL